MAKEKRTYKKESFMQGVFAMMFSQVLIKLLGLVYKMYLTNREGFGDEGNAIYSSGFYIYSLLLTLSSVGVPNAISKLVSERIAVGDNKGANRIFKIAFFIFGILGFIGTMILFLGAHYISNVILKIPEAEMTLVALSPSIFFVALICVIRGYFNGNGTLKVTANSQTLEQIFKTVFTILLVELVVIATGINTTIMAAGANLATTVATIRKFYILIYFL
ncbi:MAG: oligosaccharide flippase family protein [Clostridia bacterium]|nr:oligosaccharide flippase family protein [Clostridia bacterium]